MSVIITLAGNLNNTSFLCVWSRAHLLTTLRAVVLPDGSRALDQGDAPADLYSAGSTELGSCQVFGSALPAALLTASRHGALWQSRGVALICFYKAVAEGKNPP